MGWVCERVYGKDDFVRRGLLPEGDLRCLFRDGSPFSYKVFRCMCWALNAGELSLDLTGMRVRRIFL